jgi:UDP-N-acetyl-D-galactosamine dehydrogenase
MGRPPVGSSLSPSDPPEAELQFRFPADKQRTFLRVDGSVVSDRKLVVIGLGYVGLPVAAAFARAGYPVTAFDIDSGRISELKVGRDRTGEVAAGELANSRLRVTDDESELAGADIFIVTVPTPIDGAKRPDLAALQAASRTVGRALSRGNIVVYESTVYPGATEAECVPLLEEVSGLRCGLDFGIAYSPERINPGDAEHKFDTIKKVVAADDDATLETVAALYGSVVTAGIHRVRDIKTAEAAKLLENTQRDLNIALMNELSAICHELGMDTMDVIDAAATKWNFLRFTPGLVGGHCIGVDPYYLTHRAEQVGYHPEVILAGRRVNDTTGARVAQQCVRMLMNSNNGRGLVTILGLTFKENVPDIRNTKVVDIVRELQGFQIPVQVHDPMVESGEAEAEYGLKLMAREALRPADALIFAVPHRSFVDEGWPLITSLLKNGAGAVLDVKAKLPRDAQPPGIELWRL